MRSYLARPHVLLAPVVLAGCSLAPPIAEPDALAEPVVPVAVAPGGERGLARERADWLGAPAADDGTSGGAGSGSSTTPESPIAPHAHRVSVDAAHVPLDSLLFLLAREAALELHAHARIDTPITYRAEDRPLDSVLDQLADQASFVWRIEDGRLVVRAPLPYSDSYAIDYLNLDRSTRSRVGLATQVGTLNASATGDAGGIANSSETLIENVAEHRFWDTLATDLDGLLGEADSSGTAGAARYSLNRDVGLVTVFGTPSAHDGVRDYLVRLHRHARRQVLIEASVVEVTLSDRFEAGIDWQVLADGVNGVSGAQTFGGLPVLDAASIARLSTPSALLGLVHEGAAGSVAATLSLLETFGKVRILSRPRIIALNNQSSVLKVVDNRVYFTVEVQRRFDADREEIITRSEIHTVPVGLVMNVTPQIAEDDTVMLNVRPTLSRILGFVDDPNPELALANVRNGVPEIQVRELESMLSVASGDVAIIGGLMQDATRDDERTVPGLSRIPLLGKLFSRTARSRERSELLIVLRPTVLRRGESPPPPLPADAGRAGAAS